jgi:hypothetical protein
LHEETPGDDADRKELAALAGRRWFVGGDDLAVARVRARFFP